MGYVDNLLSQFWQDETLHLLPFRNYRDLWLAPSYNSPGPAVDPSSIAKEDHMMRL